MSWRRWLVSALERSRRLAEAAGQRAVLFNQRPHGRACAESSARDRSAVREAAAAQSSDDARWLVGACRNLRVGVWQQGCRHRWQQQVARHASRGRPTLGPELYELEAAPGRDPPCTTYYASSASELDHRSAAAPFAAPTRLSSPPSRSGLERLGGTAVRVNSKRAWPRALFFA